MQMSRVTATPAKCSWEYLKPRASGPNPISVCGEETVGSGTPAHVCRPGGFLQHLLKHVVLAPLGGGALNGPCVCPAVPLRLETNRKGTETFETLPVTLLEVSVPCHSDRALGDRRYIWNNPILWKHRLDSGRVFLNVWGV